MITRFSFRMSILLVGFAVGLMLLAVVMLVYAYDTKIATKQNSHVQCPVGTMTCPDGSTVERVTPYCDFAPCPSL